LIIDPSTSKTTRERTKTRKVSYKTLKIEPKEKARHVSMLSSEVVKHQNFIPVSQKLELMKTTNLSEEKI
jgi:uncharacterized lipoprotein YehR (DUF1307 family)